jgi:hypothetical protein
MITVPKSSDRSTLMEVKEILNAHPGDSKVTMKIPDKQNHREIKIKNTVDLSPVVINKLKKLLGKESIELI